MNLKIILLLGIIAMLLPNELKAQYNDPGSSSFIFQFLLILFGFLIFYFQKVRLFVARIWNKLWRRDPPR
jgi:hypothetical protein